MFSAQRLWRPLLLLFTLLACVLRVYKIDDAGFWLDEGLTPLRSGYSVPEILGNRITIQDGETKDTHPPLHYLLIHASRRLFGESDLAYRVPSMFAGVLLVPLLFQLARRMDGTRTALLAALLAAINPLQIWYGQEARMYTLLVLFSLAGTLALWRALTEREPGRWLGVYLLCAGLAFYTHYTAIFLILAQGIFWAWLLWQQGHRRLLVGAVVLGLLIAAPLIPFTIPRIFSGAEASYSYVSPLIMLQDIVHGFGLGRTMNLRETGVRLFDVGAGILLLVGMVASGRKGRRLSTPFLLVYLLAAVSGLMLGSLVKPMYMGVRHIMVGSPAFLLLLARGATVPARRPKTSPGWLSFALAGSGIAVLLIGWGLSLNNLYFKAAYARDDVRALIRYVDRHAGGNDLVLYNDAILMTLQWHYQERSDVQATALPIYPHSAGDATLAQLESLASHFDRIWYIGNLPADGRDDGELVKRWLHENLKIVDSFSAHGHNLEVKVVSYRTAAREMEQLPAGATALALTLGDLPTLRGFEIESSEPIALPALWLDLFWEATAPPEGQQLRFALRGPDEAIWLDQSRPFQFDEAEKWPGAGLVRSSYELAVPPGMPPGDYDLLLQPWNSGPELNAGVWQSLGRIQMADPGDWPLDPRSTMVCQDNTVRCGGPNALEFANGLSLLGIASDSTSVRPGHPIPLTLYWNAATALDDDLTYRIEVVGPGGKILRTDQGRPGADWLTADSWPLETPVREQIGLYFPPESKPGKYRLVWSLSAEDEAVAVRPAWRPWASDSATLGEFELEPWKITTDLPAASKVIRAEFGPSIELYGYDLEEAPLTPGTGMELTLYWRAIQVPDQSYTVFVHLVRAEDGSIASQLDRIPVDWLRPTNGWRPGEVLEDIYSLPVPEELAPGTYVLTTGLYLPDTWERLPVRYQDEEQPGSQLELGSWVYE